jgi:glycosyltransferase involved in cell wall biosynthesis
VVLAFDDGSTDDTVRQLEELAKCAPLPLIVRSNSKNLGFVRNFEQAIAQCDADIIALSDQDDYWQPEKLEVLESVFMEDPKAQVVFSDAEIVNENLESLGVTLLQAVRASHADRRAAVAGNVFPVLLRRNLICGAALAIRSTCKPWILPMPEGAIHDEWTALVAAAHGSVRFVPKPLIRYRQHTSNQIGLLHLNWRRRFDTLIHRHGPEAKRRLGMMHRLRQRLMDTGAPSRTLEEVDGAIRHIEHRLSLSDAYFARMNAIFREIRSGRYGKYSTGWASAMRDFVLPM